MPDWTGLLPSAPNTNAIKTTADYTWPNQATNALQLLSVANTMDERRQRQIQTNLLNEQLKLTDDKREFNKDAMALRNKPIPGGTPTIDTPIGRYATSDWDSLMRLHPIYGAEIQQELVKTQIAAGMKRADIMAKLAPLLSKTDAETARQIVEALMSGGGIPGAASTNALPIPSSPVRPQGPSNALPSPTIGQPPALLPGQPPGAPVVIDRGAGQGTVAELKGTPQGQNILQGAQPQPLPVAQSAKRTTIPTQIDVQAEANRIFADPNMPDTEKMRELGSLPTYGYTAVSQDISRKLTALRGLVSEANTASQPYKDFRAGYMKDHPNASLSQLSNAWDDKQARISGAKAGETQEAQQTAADKEADKIIKKYDLVDRLLSGATAPDDISQTFRQPFVRIAAVAAARQKDPTYNEIEADANKHWYQSSQTQRLIRRTESIVMPDGAADESIRFAKLVDNPSEMTLNKLTGRAKIEFGQSQRALLNLVQGLSSEEIQQIMGAQGGGERFLEFTNALNNPNQSVDQYVNNVKELKYLIYTRQKANVRGTPEQKKWEKWEDTFKNDRPFAPAKAAPNSPSPAQDYPRARNAKGEEMIYKDGKWQTP